jgi:hypothetical protein
VAGADLDLPKRIGNLDSLIDVHNELRKVEEDRLRGGDTAAAGIVTLVVAAGVGLATVLTKVDVHLVEEFIAWVAGVALGIAALYALKGRLGVRGEQGLVTDPTDALHMLEDGSAPIEVRSAILAMWRSREELARAQADRKDKAIHRAFVLLIFALVVMGVLGLVTTLDAKRIL